MFVFFFKQKTAYEMRISDWSSDVCSSDLRHACEVPEDVRALCEAVWNIADGARRACGLFVCDLDWVRDQPAIPLRAPSDRAILLRRGSRRHILVPRLWDGQMHLRYIFGPFLVLLPFQRCRLPSPQVFLSNH